MAVKPRPLIERLLQHVEKTDTCWLWTGAKTNGYGVMQRGGRGMGTVKAHRAMLEHSTGAPIPPRLDVMHLCHERACVNPDHLAIGTRSANMHTSHTAGRLKRSEGVGLSGSRNGMAKLTEDQARAILIDDRPLSVVAAEYGIGKTTVWGIRRRLTWPHLTSP